MDKEQHESKKREGLITLHLESVYRFCLRLCSGKTADAEDLAQDVFVQAWQHRDTFAGRAKVTTWLMRIALNRYLRLRSQVKESQVPHGAIEKAPASTTDQTLDRLELIRAMQELPDHLRAAFILVKVEGCKYREAAEILDVPTGTVQWQVHEAVQRLRATLSGVPATTCQSENTSPSNQSPKEVSHAV